MGIFWERVLLAGALAMLFAGVAWAADNKPAEGQPAPNIKLPATNIGTVLPDKKESKTLDLKDLRGKNVVLYFFPKALTGG
jgi:hypothetical protein